MTGTSTETRMHDKNSSQVFMAIISTLEKDKGPKKLIQTAEDDILDPSMIRTQNVIPNSSNMSYLA